MSVAVDQQLSSTPNSEGKFTFLGQTLQMPGPVNHVKEDPLEKRAAELRIFLTEKLGDTTFLELCNLMNATTPVGDLPVSRLKPDWRNIDRGWCPVNGLVHRGGGAL
jgi:hypothetical protein